MGCAQRPDDVAGVLAQATNVKKGGTGIAITITHEDNLPVALGGSAMIRRWDHGNSKDFPLSAGAIPVKKEKVGISVEIPLEGGIKVRFGLPGDGAPDGAEFRRGDYWLIPARAATGDIEFPRPSDKDPAFVTARIIEHHYAPIASVDGITVAD